MHEEEGSNLRKRYNIVYLNKQIRLKGLTTITFYTLPKNRPLAEEFIEVARTFRALLGKMLIRAQKGKVPKVTRVLIADMKQKKSFHIYSDLWLKIVIDANMLAIGQCTTYDKNIAWVSLLLHELGHFLTREEEEINQTVIAMVKACRDEGEKRIRRELNRKVAL